MIDANLIGAPRTATRAATLALAALLPVTAFAQPDRSVPTGNPLGTATILVPGAPATGVASAPGGAADIGRGQDEAVLRARLAAYRARQAALLAEAARPLADRGIDPGRRPGEAARAEPDARGAGGVPTIFGGGIASPFGGGVRPAWQGY